MIRTWVACPPAEMIEWLEESPEAWFAVIFDGDGVAIEIDDPTEAVAFMLAWGELQASR